MAEHILSLVLANNVGALARVCNILSRKQLNIKSLSVTRESTIKEGPRATVIVEGDTTDTQLAFRLISKNEDVLSAGIFSHGEILQRELLLIKTDVTEENLKIITELKINFRLSILRESDELVVEYMGSPPEVELFLEHAKGLEPKEIFRTLIATLVEFRQ